MYDAVTRETYAQLFKLAEAKLPPSVREETVKAASVDPVVSKALLDRWSKS
jgi:hypothetical protein